MARLWILLGLSLLFACGRPLSWDRAETLVEDLQEPAWCSSGLRLQPAPDGANGGWVTWTEAMSEDRARVCRRTLERWDWISTQVAEQPDGYHFWVPPVALGVSQRWARLTRDNYLTVRCRYYRYRVDRMESLGDVSWVEVSPSWHGGKLARSRSCELAPLDFPRLELVLARRRDGVWSLDEEKPSR